LVDTVFDFAENNLRTTRFESSICRLFCGLEFIRSLTRHGGIDMKGPIRRVVSDNLYSLKAWVICMSHVHGARAL